MYSTIGKNLPSSNPFAPPTPTAAPARGPDAPDVRYGIAASAPPVDPTEVETSDRAVEVVLSWGQGGELGVLHVAHLSPPRAFTIGEAGQDSAPDYLVGSETLGAERLPLVLAPEGRTCVVVPAGAEGEVTIGERAASWAELAQEGALSPCSEAPGAQQYLLPEGAVAEVRHGGFVWRVRATPAGKRIGTSPLGWRGSPWTAVSLAVHGALLLMFYFLPPRSSALAFDLLEPDGRLVQYLLQPPEVQEDQPPEWLHEEEAASGAESGRAHRDDSGAAGQESAERTHSRYAIEGQSADPQMARERAREQAATTGAIGVLTAMAGSWSSPTSPYGADAAIGADPTSALGALTGDMIGSNFGFGSLGMQGTGRGGGGTGEGTIGAGPFGTVGHEGGVGYGHVDFARRRPAVPRISSGVAEVRGSLSAEAIRRTVRRHVNEVRFCYEQELAQRSDLAGRVTVSFIISMSGAVQTAAVSNSTLGNARVESCIVQAVHRWTFPEPEGGLVGVTYPFVLDSSG